MKNNIREQVRAYYGDIAKKISAGSKSSCGCDTSCCGDVACCSSYLYTDDFVDGLPEEVVNASLGCANPVALANLREGEVVWTWEVVAE
jgi:hypothetical protein